MVHSEVMINDNMEVKQIDNFKYLRAYTDKDGLGETQVKHQIQQSRLLGSVNSLWWDHNILKENRKN